MPFPKISRKRPTKRTVTIITSSNDPDLIAELVESEPTLKNLHRSRVECPPVPATGRIYPL